MHQVVLKRGTAPDYGTFIYPLKVPHTHPHRKKTIGSHKTWFLHQFALLFAPFVIATFMVVDSDQFFWLEEDEKLGGCEMIY